MIKLVKIELFVFNLFLWSCEKTRNFWVNEHKTEGTAKLMSQKLQIVLLFMFQVFLTFKVKKRTLTLHAQDAINIVLLSNPSYDTFGSCLVYGANMFNEQ